MVIWVVNGYMSSEWLYEWLMVIGVVNGYMSSEWLYE